MSGRGVAGATGLALGSAFLFGAATPASKPLVEVFSPLQLVGLLYLGAALGVLPTVATSGGGRLPWRAGRATALRLSGAIASGGILAPVLLLVGLRLASAASVSLWLNLELVATAVLGCLVFHEPIGRGGWLGLAVIVAAGAALSVGEAVAGVRAGLLVTTACLFWGLDNHLTALIDELAPAQTAFWKGLVAGTASLGLGLVSAPYTASLPATAAALLVGAMSYGASMALYIASAQRLGATRSQMIFSSAPFFGAALSATALGEPISSTQATSAAALALALLLVFRDRHGHAHAHEAVVHDHAHSHDDGHHTHVHPGSPRSLWHAHPHGHEPARHVHPHVPDLHHRHGHA